MLYSETSPMYTGHIYLQQSLLRIHAILKYSREVSVQDIGPTTKLALPVRHFNAYKALLPI